MPPVTQKNPRAKVIVISAMVDDAIKDEALAAGASGFVDKSAADQLVLIVERVFAEGA